MNSEKVKEIKKDIEICMKSLNCNGCSHHSQRSGECCRNLTNDILNYISELESENETKTDTIADLLKKQEFYEKEKLKQFAERLKEKMGVREYMGVKYKQGVFSENDINETLKEFGLCN